MMRFELVSLVELLMGNASDEFIEGWNESNRKVILIVDDDLEVRTSAVDQLSLADYEVLSAADGLEALQLLEQRVPDVIISDTIMPIVDGEALYETVRENASWTL